MGFRRISYGVQDLNPEVQRIIDERLLPKPEEKLALYSTGREFLASAGYYFIGMDHFALYIDDLYQAWRKGRLHRNFMGYTTQNSGMLIGLEEDGIVAVDGACVRLTAEGFPFLRHVCKAFDLHLLRAERAGAVGCVRGTRL